MAKIRPAATLEIEFSFPKSSSGTSQYPKDVIVWLHLNSGNPEFHLKG
jgi:hypothetical protein